MKGALDARMRERIALAVAAVNGCGHCLVAHTFIGTNLAKLDAAEIAANRAGRSNDPKADAAMRFAVAVTQARGHVGDGVLAAARRLDRCRDPRDHRPCRAEHVDQLRQRGRRYRGGFPPSPAATGGGGHLRAPPSPAAPARLPTVRTPTWRDTAQAWMRIVAAPET